MVFDKQRNCFRYWWACLPAIPSSREALDWWVDGDDGRSTPYRRLKRVWNDATWFKSPANDPFRPHEFSWASTGTHMMVQLWENWTLFHPSDWVPLILGELGMEVSDGPWDACWSYEFEDASNSRLADITLHIRDGTGRETLIVIEGKWNKDRLKGKPKVGLPDADPNAYINLEGYKVVEERRMVYLVHEHAVDRTRDLVRRHITEKSCPWAILTWESLICQQFRLAEELLPKPIGQTICESILAQAKHDCISWEAVQRSTGIRKESVASVQNLVESLKTESAAADCIPRLRDYLMGASCFWESRAEGCCDTNALPFAYLHAEPSFRDLHDEILRRRAGGNRCDYLAENLIPHWKLGNRSVEVVPARGV